MKLYDLPWGPYCRRVTIYLAEKGITDIELVTLDYGDENTPELLAKNPLSYVPFLELDDGRVIVDSITIIEYLEELYPSPSFLGNDPVERASVRAYLSAIQEFSYNSKYCRSNTIPQLSRAITQSPETAKWMQPFLDRSIMTMEKLTDAAGPFLLGTTCTMADCVLYAMLHHCRENWDDHYITGDHPRLTRWLDMFSRRASAPCPLRNDGLLELEPIDPPPGKLFWWQQPKDELAGLRHDQPAAE